MRDPLPSPMTLDGNLLKFRNPERIRDLLALFSKEEIIEMLASKVNSSDGRLSDARMPLVHGASLHDSTVEARANKNVANGYPGLDGALKLTGSQVPYGSSANAACQGNDSRLSDARTPTTHNSSKHDSTVEATTNKGAASGYCELDSGSKVPANRLGTGTPDATVFLRGDRSWAAPSAVGVVPIGAILPWHKSLTGVPALSAQFLECNGQTVSDAGSPLNGQTLPDLNGNNQFLRGNSNSSGTGGASTHSHNVDDPGHYHSIQSVPGAMGVSGTDFYPAEDSSTTGISVQEADALPPFFDIVWIIRIK